ncbi:MAG: hypothetical protein ACOY4R_27815 [Pseudomonadota bacterium]
MADEYKPFLMLSQPGVTRDGTVLARNTYTEFQWCRSYQGRPRKMGGYRQLVRGVDGIIRAFGTQSINGFTYVHAGAQDVLMRFTIDNETGLSSSLVDRTPVGFDASDMNGWQFTTMYDTAGTANLIIAHAVPNIPSLTTTEERPVYYGDLTDTAALTAISSSNTSGGCVAIINYLIVYGNDGVVKWSVPGNPTDLTGSGSGDARPTANKIVRGLPLRGRGGPAALLWSLDSLVVMQWTGGAEVFDFDTITTNGSILSSNGVIEHNGIYYWATTNGFSAFNGVMRDLPNTFNGQWFLSNLNWSQRQKVFAYKVPRWNEIWWCFPFGSATECSHAVIYNYAENVWYDTELPRDMRSAGQYAQIFEYPIMSCTGNPERAPGDPILSNVWQMEYGFDRVAGTPAVPSAIPAWFKTHEFSLVEPQGLGQSGQNRSLSVNIAEPDFDQVGNLSLTVETRANARQRTPTVYAPITIPADDYTPGEQLTKLKITGRLMSFKVESNTQGGNFVAGSPLVHLGPGDGRMQS